MNNKYKILIVEDERNIRSFIETILETNGYEAIAAGSCEDGLSMYSSHCPDLVILDLGLPDADGTNLIDRVRKTATTPIIVLSARSQESDKVKALDAGANDYITKPFGTEELLARVRAAIRSKINAEHPFPDGKFSVRNLEIEYAKRSVKIDGAEIKLTQTEYNIVALLSEYAGKVLTYAFIIKSVWGAGDEGGIKKLQVNMANIRKKFGSKPGENGYIANELGVGYRMNNE